MVNVNLKAADDSVPQSKNITYDISTRTFTNNRTRAVIPLSGLVRLGDELRGLCGASQLAAREGQIGWRTIARHALFRALNAASSNGARARRGSLLEQFGAAVAGLEVDPAAGRTYPPANWTQSKK